MPSEYMMEILIQSKHISHDESSFSSFSVSDLNVNTLTISGITAGRGGGSSVHNTAFGFASLRDNQGSDGSDDGRNNSAFGYVALMSNTTGSDNTCLGYGVSDENTTGSKTTAVGAFAQEKNKSGDENVAIGYATISKSPTSAYNTAVGTFSQRNSNSTTSAFSGYNTSVRARISLWK